MASGPEPDKRRGTWSVQDHVGIKWRRVVVFKPSGWKPGAKMPIKPTPEAVQALTESTERERRARRLREHAPDRPRSVADFPTDHGEDLALCVAPGTLKQWTKASRIFLEWCRTHKIERMERGVREWFARLGPRGGMSTQISPCASFLKSKEGHPMPFRNASSIDSMGIDHIAQAWGKVGARRVPEEVGPDRDRDADAIEQCAQAAAWAVAQGTIEELREKKAA